MMKIPLITHPAYSFDFSTKHRFPMQKFRLLHEFLKAKGLATDNNTFRPGRAKTSLLALAHCPEYINQFCTNQLDDRALRQMGLPWSDALLKRSLISPAGTLLAAHYAMRYGIACHLAGGTHHAHFDAASGFCVLNDLAITAKGLIHRARLQNLPPPRILIFDCDVHQGDGTASILANEPLAFTCSIHCDKNFPARKATSDMDVEIPKGTGDDAYLASVESALLAAIAACQPSMILYDAGVDIFSGDPLGLLDITKEGIRQRDRLVLRHCRDQQIPVATVIGGGYDDDRKALARRHAIAVEEAFSLYC